MTPERKKAEEIYELILIQCSGRNEAAESIMPRKKSKIVDIIEYALKENR